MGLPERQNQVAIIPAYVIYLQSREKCTSRWRQRLLKIAIFGHTLLGQIELKWNEGMQAGDFDLSGEPDLEILQIHKLIRTEW